MNSDLAFPQVVQQGKDFLAGFTGKQRLLLGGGAVLVGGTLYVFVQLIGKPDYKTLYSGLNPGRRPGNHGVAWPPRRFLTSSRPDGTSILVPADKLDSARLEVASQPMPHSGRLGFELFDKPNWAGSDFSEKVNYQRALEAELERTLGTLERSGGGAGAPGDAGRVAVQRARSQRQGVGDGEAAPRQPAAAGGHGDSPAGGGRGRPPEPGKRGGRRCRYQPAAEPLWLRRRARAASEIDQEMAKRVVETLEPVVGSAGSAGQRARGV